MTAHLSSTSTRTALERLKLVKQSLQSNMAESITADYLVIGAGAMAMAFVDTLLSDTTDKKIVMLDRRARPGGHWVTAYPFVRLHQPAAFYGVNSRPLDSGQIDEVGWNKGLFELSSRDAVVAYFDLVMRQTFLPSGRVEFFPKHEYLVCVHSIKDSPSLNCMLMITRARVNSSLFSLRRATKLDQKPPSWMQRTAGHQSLP